MSILIKYVFYNKSENMLNGIYKRYANIYILNFNDIYLKDVKGLVRWGEDVELWHRRRQYASMGLLQKLSKRNLVRDFAICYFRQY